MDRIKANRAFMKSNFNRIGDFRTDQADKLQPPPLQKPFPDDGEIVSLPEVTAACLGENDLYHCLKNRRSVRRFSGKPLSLDELSFLLWATQGIDRVLADGTSTFRPVPSSGARHPFETYLAILRVTDIRPGVYRFLPFNQELLFMFETPDLPQILTRLTLGQRFSGQGAVLFIWSCIPYRGEWRYHVAAHKPMLLDAGHICQNLYLASSAVNCGTCAVATYDQEAIDNFLGLDSDTEFAVYLAAVGKT